MTLAYHHHSPVAVKDGHIFMASLHGVFIEEIAKHFDAIHLFLYERPFSEDFFDYKISAPNIYFCSLGPARSVLSRYLSVRTVARRILSINFDLILFRSPTPLFPFLAYHVKKYRSIATLLVGDYYNSSLGLQGPFYKVTLIRMWAYLYNTIQKKICARRCLVLPNNHLLLKEYASCSSVHLIQTVTIGDKYKYKRVDTCGNASVKILYAGRIDLDKGLMELLEAIKLLNASNSEGPVELYLVGWDDGGGASLNKMRSFIEENRIEKCVKFFGKLSVGEPLYSIYRECDIFFIGSKRSEGFPRVIWEAMLNSMPVITTRVGGIPYYVDENSVYFLREVDPKEIAERILEVICDREQRVSKIANAFSLASEVTVEQQVRKISLLIKEYHKKG